jgi:hypothetical protein
VRAHAIPTTSQTGPFPQVPGCGGSLDTGRMYNIRYRLCQPHLRAESVEFQGRVQRFCQARAFA